jgi:hypothetical protein
MSTKVFHRDTCRLCDGKEHELVLKLAPTPIGDDFIPKERLNQPQESFPLDLSLCRQCGSVQLLKTIDPEVVYGNYLYTSSSSVGLPEHFVRYVDAVVQYAKPASGAQVVELGSNEGAMLRAFKAKGFKVLGVDPAKAIAEQATRNGIETLPAFFGTQLAKKIRAERGPASIVIANNVMANIDDLTDMAGGVRTLLADDGIFVFETSYLLDVAQHALIDTIFHEHLMYYAVKPLEKYFQRHGMQLIKVDRVPTKGGSIRGTVQLASGKRPLDPSVGELKALETAAAIDRPEGFRRLRGDLDTIKRDLHAVLDPLKRSGKVIANYGAAVGLTTMVYEFDLAGLLSFMVDDYTAKQNTFSPGHHIPVYPPAALYERKPDYTLLLAWRYADNIMKQHQRYLDTGGHFVIPMPKVRVV